MSTLKKVEIRFQPKDIERLDHQAKILGTNRSELIRSRALASGQGAVSFSPQDFAELQRDAYRSTLGIMDRKQVDALVAFVFARIAKTSD